MSKTIEAAEAKTVPALTMPVQCNNPFVPKGSVSIPPLDLTKAHQFMDN